jgi:hypothetical protein
MKAEMSSKAITRRLKAVSELRDLCLKLGNAKPSGVVREEMSAYRANADFKGK